MRLKRIIRDKSNSSLFIRDLLDTVAAKSISLEAALNQHIVQRIINSKQEMMKN